MSHLRKWAYYAYSVFELLTGVRNWPTVLRIFLGKEDGQVRWLKLRKRGVEMGVRSRMDAWSVKETFLDQFYTKHGMQLEANWVVVDIGAAIGEFTVYAAKAAPLGQVFAFEPYGESYALMVENLHRNAVENVTAAQVAIWHEAGELALDLRQGEPLQAPSLAGELTAHSHNKIRSITLADFFKTSGVAQVDLLKLDCEGAEFPILLNLPTDLWERIQRIVLEYHDGYQGYQHGVLAELLLDQGYKVWIEPNWVHEEIGYLYAIKPGKSS